MPTTGSAVAVGVSDGVLVGGTAVFVGIKAGVRVGDGVLVGGETAVCTGSGDGVIVYVGRGSAVGASVGTMAATAAVGKVDGAGAVG